MLLILFLVRLLASPGTTVIAHSVHSRASVDSCDDLYHCRKLFDIIRNCLVTILAFTWISVHPNVPEPNQSSFALTLRRARIMLIAIIAPELIVVFAARQFLAAWQFSKVPSSYLDFKVSMTHGFFFSMGGFVSRDGRHPITTTKQLIFGFKRNRRVRPDSVYMSAIREIDAKDIMDKSKGDSLSKGAALLQGLWFVTQCIARRAQRLPITELEITTLAFAVVNVFTWLLWWSKPLDVHRP
ncbi:hypothetical protein K438DRAFT_1634816, partial [Mycena galopus ATCC 62051]